MRLTDDKPLLTLRKSLGEKVFWWFLVLILFVIAAACVVWGMMNPHGRGHTPFWLPWVLATGMLVVAVLLSWLLVFRSERFDVESEGIRWRKGRCPERWLTWREITAIRFPDGMRRLVLQGPPEGPTLKISQGYGGFEALLELLRRQVDWERLIRAGMARKVQPDLIDCGPQGTVPIFPIVVPRFGPVLASFGLALFFGGFGYYVWIDRPGANNSAPIRPENFKEKAFRELSPFITVGLLGIGLASWYRMRIERDGVDLESIIRTRHISWDQIASIAVELRAVEVQGSKTYSHHLIVRRNDGKEVRRNDGKELDLGLGNRAFEIRDAIVAAALHEGIRLGAPGSS